MSLLIKSNNHNLYFLIHVIMIIEIYYFQFNVDERIDFRSSIFLHSNCDKKSNYHT